MSQILYAESLDKGLIISAKKFLRTGGLITIHPWRTDDGRQTDDNRTISSTVT